MSNAKVRARRRRRRQRSEPDFVYYDEATPFRPSRSATERVVKYMLANPGIRISISSFGYRVATDRRS